MCVCQCLYCLTMLGVILVFLLFFLGTCFESYRHNNICLRKPVASHDPSHINKSDKKINLPIVQIYEGGLLNREILFNEEDGVADFVNKLMISLGQWIKKNTSEIRKDRRIQQLNIIYDDSQLDEAKKTYDIIVLKLFRIGCKKCVLLDPTFDELPEMFDDSKIFWCQSDVDNLPIHLADLKHRLSGQTSTNHVTPSDCDFCKNSGFIMCSECNGSGNIQRGVYSVWCSACVGKIIRPVLILDIEHSSIAT